jgi:uncharacterized membrane protein
MVAIENSTLNSSASKVYISTITAVIKNLTPLIIIYNIVTLAGVLRLYLISDMNRKKPKTVKVNGIIGYQLK